MKWIIDEGKAHNDCVHSKLQQFNFQLKHLLLWKGASFQQSYVIPLPHTTSKTKYNLFSFEPRFLQLHGHLQESRNLLKPHIFETAFCINGSRMHSYFPSYLSSTDDLFGQSDIFLGTSLTNTSGWSSSKQAETQQHVRCCDISQGINSYLFFIIFFKQLNWKDQLWNKDLWKAFVFVLRSKGKKNWAQVIIFTTVSGHFLLWYGLCTRVMQLWEWKHSVARLGGFLLNLKASLQCVVAWVSSGRRWTLQV